MEQSINSLPPRLGLHTRSSEKRKLNIRVLEQDWGDLRKEKAILSVLIHDQSGRGFSMVLDEQKRLLDLSQCFKHTTT